MVGIEPERLEKRESDAALLVQRVIAPFFDVELLALRVSPSEAPDIIGRWAA